MCTATLGFSVKVVLKILRYQGTLNPFFSPFFCVDNVSSTVQFSKKLRNPGERRRCMIGKDENCTMPGLAWGVGVGVGMHNRLSPSNIFPSSFSFKSCTATNYRFGLLVPLWFSLSVELKKGFVSSKRTLLDFWKRVWFTYFRSEWVQTKDDLYSASKQLSSIGG